jgi:hypothetical protein
MSVTVDNPQTESRDPLIFHRFVSRNTGPPLSNGYNVFEGEKVLGTSMVENITFRKGTNPLKKRHYKGLDLLENPPIRNLNNSVTVE